MTKDLKSLFPKASNAFLKANEKVLGAIAPDIHAADKTFAPEPATSRRGRMNATERNFALILEAQKRNGEIASYEFEGITLRWECGYDRKGKPIVLRYTPDFVVFPVPLAVSGQIKLIEVKGNYIKGHFERAIERFRHAKTYYGDRFLFEMHQKTRDGWKRRL